MYSDDPGIWKSGPLQVPLGYINTYILYPYIFGRAPTNPILSTLFVYPHCVEIPTPLNPHNLKFQYLLLSKMSLHHDASAIIPTPRRDSFTRDLEESSKWSWVNDNDEHDKQIDSLADYVVPVLQEGVKTALSAPPSKWTRFRIWYNLYRQVCLHQSSLCHSDLIP